MGRGSALGMPASESDSAGRQAKRNGGVTRVVAVLAALVVGVAGCREHGPYLAGAQSVAGSGKAARPSTARLVPATSRDILRAVSEARGSVVLVNVWATWCEPCREEFPALVKLRHELTDKPFKLILVSADFPELRQQVERFLADRGVDFPTFFKVENDNEFVIGLEARWSGALPATIVFDAKGKRRDFWEGKASYERFAESVATLLRANTAAKAGTEAGLGRRRAPT